MALPIVLLLFSNIFMTFAWYGHLAHKDKPLFTVIMVSWGIAFFEYCLQVPANRWGHAHFSAAQLKIIQEAITLIVFAAFSVWWLREDFRWNHAVAFGFIMLAVVFMFLFNPKPAAVEVERADNAIVRGD